MKFQIKQLLSTIVLIILSFSSIAQERDNYIILEIDTLLGVQPPREEFSVRICFDTNSNFHHIDTFINANFIKREGFYSVKLRIEKEYKTEIFTEFKVVQSIDLLFDKTIGFVSIRNLKEISTDTIRIDKWIVYKSNIPDTIIRSTVYQNKINDSIVSYYNKVDTQIIAAKLKTKELNSTIVTINDKPYILSPEIYSENINVTFSGAKPLKTFKAFQENQRTNKKYKYTRFHGKSIKVKSVYNGIIYLDNPTGAKIQR